MLPDRLRSLTANRRITPIAAGGVLLLITIIVHHQALNGGWYGDDLQQIISIKDHSFSQLFFSPRAWRTFTKYFFTPFLAFQYQLDVWLFGYNPRDFLLHNLLDLAATVTFTFYLWSRRFPPLLAFIACIGFLLTMPAFGISTFLHSRHYVAGLFFAIASIYVHQNAYRGNMTRNLLASSGLFFMALTCKEIYAMTLLYFILRSWRSPAFIRSLIIYPTLAIIFATWRWYMLGDFVGGYAFSGTILERIKALVCVHRAIFGSDAVAVSCLGIIGCVAIYHHLLDLRRMLYLAAILLAAYAPLLFVTFIIYDYGSALRLAFFPAWIFFAAITYVATLLWEKENKKTAMAVLLGFLAVTTTASVQQIGSFRERDREENTQAAFIRNGGSESAIFISPPLSNINANIHRRFTELGGLKPSNVIATMDDVVPGITSYWEYDRHCRCMVRLSQVQVQEKLAKIPQAPAERSPIAIFALFQAQRGIVRLVTKPDLMSECFVTISGLGTGCPWDKGGEPSMETPTERMDWSHTRIYRVRNDGLITFTPFLQIPWSGTVQWDRGVFFSAQTQPSIQHRLCHIDTPLQKTIQLKPTDPIEIRGWIQMPSGIKLDAVPFATLNGTDGKYYVANLYRTLRPDVKQDTGQTVIDAHILDADFNRVVPGAYRLLLGIENALCDTGVRVTMESS